MIANWIDLFNKKDLLTWAVKLFFGGTSILQHVVKNSFESMDELRRYFMSHPDYLCARNYRPHVPLNQEENAALISWAYRIFLEREPENDFILEQRFTDLVQLWDNFLQSSEFHNLEQHNSTRSINLITNFDEFDEFIEQCGVDEHGANTQNLFRNTFISFSHFYDLFGSNPSDEAPFSEQYVNWEKSFFEFLSGKSYRVFNEGYHGIDFDSLPHPLSHVPLTDRADQIAYYCDLVNTAGIDKTDTVLEMGCGQGNLGDFLESYGCQYHAIDASEDFVEITKRRLFSKKTKKNVRNLPFDGIEYLPENFDHVIFEASFHHCFNPVELLRKIHNKTTDKGRLIFIKEPIGYNMRRPWGVVRCDGESIYQMRRRGWIEYGFNTDYFTQLLKYTNWNFQGKYLLHGNGVLYMALK